MSGSPTTTTTAGTPRRSTTRTGSKVSGRGQTMLMLGLAVALMASVAASISLGAVTIAPTDSWQVVAFHLFPGLTPPEDPGHSLIVWQFRLPRTLLAVLVGGCLGLVGTAMQAVVRNPLADPYLLGVSAGAALGAVVVIVLGAEAASGPALSGSAFAGAVVATAVVYLLAQRRGRITSVRLVLAGVALSYAFQAGYSYLLLRASSSGGADASGVLFWLLGSLAGTRLDDLLLPAAALGVGGTLLLLQARPLNSLLAGDEAATSLGLDVHRFRIQMLLLTSLLVGVMVAVSGAIAFVGLVVPHTVRLLVGADHRRVLPASALLGATFLVLVDLFARTAAEPAELPLSIVTALVGVPFFLWLLRRRDRSDEGGVG